MGREAADEGVFGWWFAARAVKAGDEHRWSGDPVPGHRGLHASPSPLAALPFAKSGLLCRVELGDEVVEVEGQLAATWRRVEWTVDAIPVLREHAERWVEALLGGPSEGRAEHREHAVAARERAVEADDRERDARWRLEGRGSAAAKARAEGELAGAVRAGAEARREAAVHEAAAALGEGDDIRVLARAIDQVLHALAALEEGSLDEALLRVRARLDEELVAALESMAPEPQPQPERPTPPPDDAPAPSEETPSAWRRWVSDGFAALLKARRTEPRGAWGARSGHPRGPARQTGEDLDRNREHMEKVFSQAELTPPNERRRMTAKPEPIRASELTVVELGRAPEPSAEAVIERLGAILDADPAFVSLHRTFARWPLVFAIRRVRVAGSDELLDALDTDPVLSASGLRFVVTWDIPIRLRGWHRAGQAVPQEVTERHVREAVGTPPIEVEEIDRLVLELLLDPSVMSVTWADGAERYLAIQADGSDPSALLARAARGGAAAVVIRDGAAQLTYCSPAAHTAYTLHVLRLQQRLGPGRNLLERVAPDAGKPDADRSAGAKGERPSPNLAVARLGRASIVGDGGAHGPWARLAAALALAPPHLGVFPLVYLDGGWVIEVEDEYADPLAVQVARALGSDPGLVVFIAVVDEIPTAESVRVVGTPSWIGSTLDDDLVAKYVLMATLGEPATTDGAARPFATLLETLASLPSVTLAGVVRPSPELPLEGPLIVLRVVDAFAAPRVRATLEAAAPDAALVFVTGASRLNARLDGFPLTMNERAEALVADIDELALARALYEALTERLVYVKPS